MCKWKSSLEFLVTDYITMWILLLEYLFREITKFSKYLFVYCLYALSMLVVLYIYYYVTSLYRKTNMSHFSKY